ncbi:MAG: UDP-N-acetylmuramoyl-L-alanyl-D-glutamate--2,6-diaminopimelate ligase [Ignavibacteria bacterium]|jgi:UDP-N-acetylmuramoyl-L-alanyl-D-glutamate--2,6-diaminopimelate ligase|nr:UDP-N-acetylmuramoyl-L-alanyl-D-glutamate--2,6-diaminopimelate ligase [Ignavibacteria bacterium]
MQLEKLLSDITYTNIYNLQDIDIAGIAYDSRLCKDNYIFVANKGTATDGNFYISNAIAAGAKVVVCENMPESADANTMANGITYITTTNPRITLAELAHSFYNNPTSKLKLIGITGTNGKTTTTFLVKSILEAAGKQVGIIGTTGIYINQRKIEATHTTPESLELAQIFSEMVAEGIEYVVMEVSSHSIAMHRIHGIEFNVAGFTNLTHEHLDFHKTMDDYANTKQQLFTNLNKTAVAIVNADDEYATKMVAKCPAIIKTFGIDTSADYRIDDVHIDMKHTTFTLNKNPITTQLTAYFNVQNATLAIAICIELGFTWSAVSQGIAMSKGAAGRLELVAVKSGATAYVDYAHTPDALEKSLITCRELIDERNGGKLICIFGCGGDRDKTKRPIMGAIAVKYADVVIVTDDNPRTEESTSIINDILVGINDSDNVQVINNRSDAIAHSIAISKKDDVILVAGKGHEDYQIIGTTKHHFSDVEELQKHL